WGASSTPNTSRSRSRRTPCLHLSSRPRTVNACATRRRSGTRARRKARSTSARRPWPATTEWGEEVFYERGVGEGDDDGRARCAGGRKPEHEDSRRASRGL